MRTGRWCVALIHTIVERIAVASNLCRRPGPHPLARGHPRLKVDTEPFGDTVDVVEERDDLRGIVDRPIGKAQRPQPIDVSLGNTLRFAGQLDRVIAQCPIDLGKLGLGVIGRDLLDQCSVFDLNPEIVGMGKRSVEAAVGLRNHNREHFALSAGKRRFA